MLCVRRSRLCNSPAVGYPHFEKKVTIVDNGAGMKLKPDDLLADWLLRIRIAQLAHVRAAVYFYRLNFWLGIPVVILTTLIGTSAL
jgi:hypothetical protein